MEQCNPKKAAYETGRLTVVGTIPFRANYKQLRHTNEVLMGTVPGQK